LISGTTSGTCSSIRNAVVDHHGAGPNRPGDKLPGNAGARAEEGNLDPFEAGRPKFLDHNGLAAERELFALGPGRGEQPQFPRGEITALQALHQLDAHRAGCPYNGHS